MRCCQSVLIPAHLAIPRHGEGLTRGLLGPLSPRLPWYSQYCKFPPALKVLRPHSAAAKASRFISSTYESSFRRPQCLQENGRNLWLVPNWA